MLILNPNLSTDSNGKVSVIDATTPTGAIEKIRYYFSTNRGTTSFSSFGSKALYYLFKANSQQQVKEMLDSIVSDANTALAPSIIIADYDAQIDFDSRTVTLTMTLVDGTIVPNVIIKNP